ncbi:protein indeterminate-domain 12-like, partial [Salvia hispanica]|uniref:protein indeterminate-domain 12-like n=1 Tax=Salvia hispanica TaxID=49212 RepID=UPI0020098861
EFYHHRRRRRRPHPPQVKPKKKRNPPGNPDPDAEVIALSPKTLMTANRFVCEICNKGFQRDQNLQLHRKGHNLPWKLKQRSTKEARKRAYVCPEPSCLYHHPSRALGDLTGIKKHYCRKHSEKKWKCEKCSKIYAVQSDWKAHSKNCGTREYRCDCGTLFSRKDSFITHRAFCDALAEESARLSAVTNSILDPNSILAPNPDFALAPAPVPAPAPAPAATQPYLFTPPNVLSFSSGHHRQFGQAWGPQPPQMNLSRAEQTLAPQLYQGMGSVAGAAMSATALLQRAAAVGPAHVGSSSSSMAGLEMAWQRGGGGGGGGDVLTRDFLGLTGGASSSGGGGGGGREELLPLVKLSAFERDHSYVMRQHGFGFGGWGNC